MAKKSKFSLEPQKLDRAWYYEENGGIDIIVDTAAFSEISTRRVPIHVKIPWRKLRASLKRKDA